LSQLHNSVLHSKKVKRQIHENQVLVLSSGSNLGTPSHPIAIVNSILDGGFASNAFLAFEFKETPFYYGMVFKHPFVLKQILAIASGNIVSTIRKKDILKIQIPILRIVLHQHQVPMLS